MRATRFPEMRGKNVVASRQRSLASAVVLGLLCGAAGDARADTANDVKGTVGGAMLGAEIVMLTESAFRLRPGWMYMAGGAGGALLGGYLGHKISDDSSNRPPSFLLAGGIALIIPTIMGVLTATQYEPIGSVRQELPDDDAGGASDDDANDGDANGLDSNEEPSADDVEGGGSARAPHLELPGIGLARAFSRDELATFGVRQVTELHLSVLRGVF